MLKQKQHRTSDRKRARCPLEVAAFNFFMFSQSSVSSDKDLTELDIRLDGAATPNEQCVHARVPPLSV